MWHKFRLENKKFRYPNKLQTLVIRPRLDKWKGDKYRYLIFMLLIIELDRGVPMGQTAQIMVGSFRRGLDSEVVRFENGLSVQPSPQYKSDW